MSTESDPITKQKSQAIDTNNMQTIVNVYTNNDYLKIGHFSKSPEHKDAKDNKEIKDVTSSSSYKQKNLVIINSFSFIKLTDHLILIRS